MIVQTQPCIRRYGAATSMAPHVHPQPSLSIVVHGDFEERVGRNPRLYARGHAAFFPAGIPHAQSFGVRGARQVSFEPRASWIDYLADCRMPLDQAPHAHSATFRALGDRLVEEIRAGDAFSALGCEGLMLEVVAAFGREATEPDPRGRPPAWLRAARDFMHEQAPTPLSLSEIAAAAGRHEIHLAREFRRYFGLSVGAYLRRLRLEHAARLLERSGLSLTEVALECGFSSHAHFCRAFRARYGVTPSHYRARS